VEVASKSKQNNENGDGDNCLTHGAMSHQTPRRHPLWPFGSTAIMAQCIHSKLSIHYTEIPPIVFRI
jgi:hypothetical protein